MGGVGGWCHNDIKAIPAQLNLYWPTGTELGNSFSSRAEISETKRPTDENNDLTSQSSRTQFFQDLDVHKFSG